MPLVCYFRRNHYFIFMYYRFVQSDKRDIAIPLSAIFTGAVSTSVFYLSSDRYCGCSATDTAGRHHCCFSAAKSAVRQCGNSPECGCPARTYDDKSHHGTG